MTDLFTHWIDVVHWAMKADTPTPGLMLADKYVFEQWDCPDTIQAAFRYPGFDVVYEGMMGSSIDDGGLEFRGTEATLKIDRGGFAVYREGVQSDQNPVLKGRSFRDGTISHMENFLSASRRGRSRMRRWKRELQRRGRGISATWRTIAGDRRLGRGSDRDFCDRARVCGENFAGIVVLAAGTGSFDCVRLAPQFRSR